MSRTPAFVIAWQMHRMGAGPDKDLKLIWSRLEDQIGAIRPIIQVHHVLKRSILHYFGYEYASMFGEIER